MKAGERLKYLILNAPKENPNIIYNDDYKLEIKKLIEEIKDNYQTEKENKDDQVKKRKPRTPKE